MGVSNRVAFLADRPFGAIPKNTIPYKSLVPLRELIGEILGVGPSSKKVALQYDLLIQKLGSELEILLETPIKALKETSLPEIAIAIDLMRKEKVQATPGYDGVYGKIKVLGGVDLKKSKQKKLFNGEK